MDTGSEYGVDNTIRLVLLGATAGVLSGLLGIGGGIILVPALVLLSDLPSRKHKTRR